MAKTKGKSHGELNMASVVRRKEVSANLGK